MSSLTLTRIRQGVFELKVRSGFAHSQSWRGGGADRPLGLRQVHARSSRRGFDQAARGARRARLCPARDGGQSVAPHALGESAGQHLPCREACALAAPQRRRMGG